MEIIKSNNNFLIKDEFCKTNKIVKYYIYEKQDKYDPIYLFLYFQGVKKRTKMLNKHEFEITKNLLYDMKCDINITNYKDKILIAKSIDFINLELSHINKFDNDRLIKDFLANTICEEEDFNLAIEDYKIELEAMKDDISSFTSRISSDEIYNHDEKYITYEEEIAYIENVKYKDIQIEEVCKNTLVRSNKKEYEFDVSVRHNLKRYIPSIEGNDKIVKRKLEQANHYIYYSFGKTKPMVLKLFTLVIGGFATSRLFTEVREKNSLCYFVYSRDLGNKSMYIHIGLKSSNINKAEKVIKELLLKPITIEELEETKQQFISYYNKKRNDYFLNKKLCEDYLFEDKDYDIDKIIEKINSVSLEEVNHLLSVLERKKSITIE